jgi:hypothetical protein
MPIHWNTSKDVWQDLVQHVAERTVHEAEQRGWTDFYHVSPRANRESIQNMGLMGENGTSPWGDPHERGQPHGNYMFDNSQDAENYAWNLKDREQGSSPYEEMPYEYPDPPEDFHTWPEEQQDEWYDNVEPVERIEDPNGYDVWKVNTRNLPIHRDPEMSIGADSPHTPSTLQQSYRSDDYPSTHDQYGGAWQQQMAENMRTQGQTPRRFYTPEAVEPQRMQLQQHMPSWDMTEEEMYNRMDDPETTEQESPASWDEMNLRRPQFPAHSSWHFADAGTTFNPVAPIDELTNYLSEGAGSASGMLNPNNALSPDAHPEANLSNPNMNPTLPGAFNNPSNPKLNADLPGAQTNLANPEFNPSTPGAQNNPSNPSYNTALPGAVNNPASPSLNPAYPGSMTNPSTPYHNPDYPNPSGIGQRPDDLGPNASFPAQVQSNARTWAPVRSWEPREASDPWGTGRWPAISPDESGYYYHEAPTTERDRIQAHGLIPGRPSIHERWDNAPNKAHMKARDDTGVYVTNQPGHAEHIFDEPMDTWRIPSSQVTSIKTDTAFNGGGRIMHPVQPEMHEPFEMKGPQDHHFMPWHVPGPTEPDQHMLNVGPHYEGQSGVAEPPPEFYNDELHGYNQQLYDDKSPNAWGLGMPNRVWGSVREWTPYVAMPREADYYHGAPTSERDRIMQHGLQPGNPQLNGMWQLQDAGFTPEEAMRQVHHRTTEPGVYMADGMDTAYKDNGRNDVWHINPDYIDENQLKRDPNWGNSGISPAPIPAEALTLQQPSEDAMWSQHEQDTAAQQLEQQRQERQEYDANKGAWGIGQPVMSREASSYWHVTDDPNFQVNPNQIPFDTNEGKKPGLFVSQDPHYWASMFNSHPEELASNEYENETPRGYLAEMNVQPEGFGNRGYGQEWFIDHPSQDQVKRVWPMQEGLNEYDRQAPDREQEAIQQWQHTGALDFNPGGHPFRQNKQWMQEWGRGAITPDGEMHTWPESQALHNEMIHQLGFTPYSDDSVTFRISPQGQVRPQDVGPWQNKSDSWIEQQIASRDPRLNSGSVDPEWQRAQGWDPDTGEWIGSHTAATHKIGGMPAEMVPIDALQHLREWDRRPGQDAGADQAYWDKLKGHIAEHGIEEPLSIEYNPNAGSGYLGEGNHRLAIAQELGMTHVPAYVYRSTKTAPDWPMQPMHQPGQYKMLDARGFSQFGQYMKPSDIGLPTAGPFESPSDDWYQQQRAERTAADIPGSEMGDANQHADPTEPRPAAPGFPKGCTCDEGLKLECPVHGMHATEADYDHSWSIPEGSPIGWPQADQPRGWAAPYSS